MLVVTEESPKYFPCLNHNFCCSVKLTLDGQVHVPIDGSKKNGKGFAYILFTDAENAITAHKAMDGSIFQGRLLHVLPAAPKRENRLDEFAISKLPLKQQRQLRRKTDATTMSFNWNSLFMNVRPTSHPPPSIPDLLTFSFPD